jgi:aspartyl-tRNA(Asn)/glutamyl-tRNA(Gln) amidotransferase subunit B
LPLCCEGNFEGVRIRRAHLEEDAGKLLHEAPGGFRIDHSIVDLNRAGTPLLEIVTEPDLTSAKQVAAFGQQLQKLVQFLGVSEGQMQMGHMRFEPNINVHITEENGDVHKTAITEIKNLNSFSVLERATDFEIARQIRQWQETGSLGKKSTYGWDESTQSTFHQRDKEEANDYRYFPDPDLMPVEVSEQWLTELKSQIGELPAARKQRYKNKMKLPEADAEILASDRDLGNFYESAVKASGNEKRVANLILSHGLRLANEYHKNIYQLENIKPQLFGEVAKMIDAGQIPASGVAPIFDTVVKNPRVMEQFIVQYPNQSVAYSIANGLEILLQSSDTGAIDAAIDAVIAQNPKPVTDYKGGKQAALGSLVGMVMKSSKGLNPKLVQERLKTKLQ